VQLPVPCPAGGDQSEEAVDALDPLESHRGRRRIPFRSCDPPRTSLDDEITWLVHRVSRLPTPDASSREYAAPLGSSRPVTFAFDKPVGISPSSPPAPYLHGCFPKIARRTPCLLPNSAEEPRPMKSSSEDVTVARSEPSPRRTPSLGRGTSATNTSFAVFEPQHVFPR
jgi:hypothetical protein